MEKKKTEIAIVGGGPAGYTAALYAARAGRQVTLFEKASPGGQMGITSRIENYPGFSSVDGFELALKMAEQATAAGATLVQANVRSCALDGDTKVLETTDGTYEADAVILATGAKPRVLGVPGEAEYTGHGVSYCATCDGMFYRKKTVLVNGGGDTAIEDALYLSNVCERVILVHRRNEFRAVKAGVDRVRAKENITLMFGRTVEEIHGENGRVTAVKLKSADGEETVAVDGVFVAIGRVPETDFLADGVALDKNGYIVAGEDTKTSLGGVFAAGDCRTKELRQIVTAASDGAMASRSAEEWLDKKAK